METNITGSLTAIRTHLEEAAWGPEAATQTRDQQASAGELDAVNDTTISDDVDAYFNEMIDQLLQAYDTTEDEAIEFVFDVADEMAEEGLIPAVPDEDADDEELALWLGQAKTAGLHIHVSEAANESAE